MKQLFILVITILFSNICSAQNQEIPKSYFYSAKTQIENMLDGKEVSNYEKAIFIMENAWYENQIDKTSFENAITLKVKAIKQLAASNYDASVFHKNENSLYHKPNAEDLYNKALTNWAIYTYMTSTTFSQADTELICHTPYSYSFADPMATIDWRNSQVINLNNTKQGNCFALASLYKILANRLNANATLCTAPSHIYISHQDENGTDYNIELGSRNFPGTGTISVLTHSSLESIRSNIALRSLTEKQAVALCLVYLAKSYQHKFNISADEFMMSCATATLKYDKLSLNAMLLKCELFEHQFTNETKSITQLRANKQFIEYEKLIANLYKLGYREMPIEMKNQLIKGWTRDTITTLANNHYKTAEENAADIMKSRHASLSWGIFDEEFAYKPIERYGNALFDTKTNHIKQFSKEKPLHNNYDFDPVVFAWNIDPLASKYPSISPYVFVANNPILYVDKDGRKIYFYGDKINELSSMIKKGTGLSIEYNSLNNQISASLPNLPYTPSDRDIVLLEASSNPNINVNIYTTTKPAVILNTGLLGALQIDAFGGSKVSADGTVNTEQFINTDQVIAAEKVGYDAPTIAIHAVMESYSGGKNFPGETMACQDDYSNKDCAYQRSHKTAVNSDKKWVNLDIRLNSLGDVYNVHNSSTHKDEPLLYSMDVKRNNAVSSDQSRNNQQNSGGGGPTGCFDNIPTIPTK